MRPLRTVCRRGHALTDETTIREQNGRRACRECRALEASGAPPTCRRGHPWTPANTLVSGENRRNCRTCRTATDRARYRGRNGAATRIGITDAEYTAHVARGEKWCTGCKGWHMEDLFGRDSDRGDGLRPMCRSFAAARQRARVAARAIL